MKVVIPSDVWKNQIVPYYSTDMKLPDLSSYMKKPSSSPKGRKRTKVMEDMNNDARRKRLLSDGLLTVEKKTTLTRGQILESRRTIEDADGRWILRIWEKLISEICNLTCNLRCNPRLQQI